MIGIHPYPTLGSATSESPRSMSGRLRLISQMYKEDSLAASVAEGFHVRDEVYQSISRENVIANRNAVSPKGFRAFGAPHRSLDEGGYNLGFVVSVAGTPMSTRRRYRLPCRSLERTRAGIGLALPTKLVPTPARYGRCRHFGIRPHIPENGDKGTDHGHGSVYWVLVARSTAAVL